MRYNNDKSGSGGGLFSREIRFTGIERELQVKPVGNKVTSVVGPRRAGKTWYFYSLFSHLDRPMYVNLEDVAFRRLSTDEFFDIIRIFSQIRYEPRTIMLDEVQSIEG